MKKITLFLTAFLAAACAAPTDNTAMVGNDRDAHNCIGSAGYTWSEVRQACIRLWEEGFTLFDAQDENAASAAYGIMSSDFSQIELFLPAQTKAVLLARDGQVWADKSNQWRLVRHPSQVGQQELWELFENGQLRFKASPVLTVPLD